MVMFILELEFWREKQDFWLVENPGRKLLHLGDRKATRGVEHHTRTTERRLWILSGDVTCYYIKGCFELHHAGICGICRDKTVYDGRTERTDQLVTRTRYPPGRRQTIRFISSTVNVAKTRAGSRLVVRSTSST